MSSNSKISQRSTMKLVSYAQRRKLKKSSQGVAVSQSIDDLSKFKQTYTTNRSTLGMPTDLRKLREAKKIQKMEFVMDEEDDREEMLFKDLDSFDQDKISIEDSSRNIVSNRNAVSYSKKYRTSNCDEENPFEQNSSISEENFHEENIEEFDEISTPKSNVNFHTNQLNPQK